MLTEKDYCDYETCVALKELGYVGTGEECSYFGAYFNNGNDIFTDDLNNNEIGVDEYLRVPLFLAQKWLREEGLFVNVELFGDYDRDADGKRLGTWVYYSYGILNTTTADFIREYDLCTEYQTYEEALSEGIKDAVKILKDGNGI